MSSLINLLHFDSFSMRKLCGSEQEQSFQILKQVITSHPVLQYYDPKKGINISLDASQDGLGAVILQQHDGQLLPVAFASRAMTDAEIRYAQIEKELLGITFACERFHQFIFGATFDAETDHKPLVNLMKKPLNDCPLRIQILMLHLQKNMIFVCHICQEST